MVTETTKATKTTKTTKKKKTAKNLVIVESPAKAKTLKKFLGSSYKIEASMGHVRDLPKSQLGVDLENDFEPRYITIRGKGELLKKLRREVKSAKKIYLATDPDREGEAISWHLLHTLNTDDKEISRITFNEITKSAVKKSLTEAREIDIDLVNAQQARRALDRIVGYQISPILWEKVKKGLSAGRVQSVALKLICDREEEIANFNPEEYWTIDSEIKKGKKVIGLSFSNINGKKVTIDTEEKATKIEKGAKSSTLEVVKINESDRVRNPKAPFKTSTLQQSAYKSLNFLTSKTMQISQQLYEGVDIEGHGTVGLVTYIRTDSTRISDEAYEQCKNFITNEYGENYLPESRNIYKDKNNGQDAHEAIRPTYIDITPEIAKKTLSRDQFRLYKLIWERFVGSQMTNANFKVMQVDFESKYKDTTYGFRATGRRMIFDGFLKVMKSQEDLDKDNALPEFQMGEKFEFENFEKNQHFTKPPARFNDASLVNTLEEKGIGRPSTYAPTISTITTRGYITREEKIIYPTELGEIVNRIMEDNFPNIIDADFTASMENKLDKVEMGEIEWKNVLREFYPDFSTKIEEAKANIEEVEIKDEETDIVCEECGRNMVIKQGKYGKFLACPGFPECRNTKPYLEDSGARCPQCDGIIYVKKTKKGRKYFGCEFNTLDDEDDKKCEFISWNKPAGKGCPKCNSFMVEKGGKKKKIACSSDTCNYYEDIIEE